MTQRTDRRNAYRSKNHYFLSFNSYIIAWNCIVIYILYEYTQKSFKLNNLTLKCLYKSNEYESCKTYENGNMAAAKHMTTSMVQNTILYHYTHWREGEAKRQLSQLGTYTARS